MLQGMVAYRPLMSCVLIAIGAGLKVTVAGLKMLLLQDFRAAIQVGGTTTWAAVGVPSGLLASCYYTCLGY